MIMVGRYESKSKFDKSIITADLHSLVTKGLIRAVRTRDFRRPSGPPKFPMKILSEQLIALRNATRINTLSAEQQCIALEKMVNAENCINWVSDFVQDESFGQAKPETTLRDLEDLELDNTTGIYCGECGAECA